MCVYIIVSAQSGVHVCVCVSVSVCGCGEGERERASTCTDKVLNLLIADSTPVRLCMVLSVATDASITR